MLPIWKQLLLGLVDLMDGEIFLGCPAEPADRNPINHSPPAPTDGHPPQLRPTGQGFCQGISSSLHLSLDHRQTYLIMLSVSLCQECSLHMYLLLSHSDYHFIFAMVVLFVLTSCFVFLMDCCPGHEFPYQFILVAPAKREVTDSKWCKCKLGMSQKTRLSVKIKYHVPNISHKKWFSSNSNSSDINISLTVAAKSGKSLINDQYISSIKPF